MADRILDYPMPKSMVDLLLAMVEMCEQNEVLTLTYFSHPDRIGSPTSWYKLVAGAAVQTVENLQGDPMVALESLDLIRRFGDKEIVLTTKAFEWAAYQRKSRIGKWLARLSEIQIVAIVTVVLAVLQSIQIVLQLNGLSP